MCFDSNSGRPESPSPLIVLNLANQPNIIPQPIAYKTSSILDRSSFLNLVMRSLVLSVCAVLLQTQLAFAITIYNQCGGIGWTGTGTCDTGLVCVVLNAYYYQCLEPTTSSVSTAPGSTVSSTSTTTKATSTKASTSTTSKTSTSTSSSASSSSTVVGPSKLVGKTPALGWNSWNAYGGNINENIIYEAAQSVVSLGLAAAGYEYVNVDDTWSNITGRDPTTQRIKPDSNKFPSGIAALATKIHALGLKFGVYGDEGTETCSGYPGSLGYEEIDAQTFSGWGVDYIKMDNCNVPASWNDASTYTDWFNSMSAKRYYQMTTALATVSNPILYSICNWGNAEVPTWGARVGHSWRLTGDASASWSFVTSSISTAVSWAAYTNFYGHGDMDMMEIGNGGLTIEEERSHFAAWVFLKSPILLGTNLATLSAAELAIVKNAELLAFHQDTTYGAPAMPFSSSTTPPELYAGQSVKGTHVFVLNTLSSSATKTITFSAVPNLPSASSYVVHDMWAGSNIGTYSGSYSFTLATHDTAAFLITPA